MQQAREQQVADAANGACVLIALGANLTSPLGPPQVGIAWAIDQLESRIGRVTGKSRLFETPCFPAGAGPDYVNAAVRIYSARAPADILKTLHDLEAECRRERRERWGARTLDLDLLAVGETVLPDAETQNTWRKLDDLAQRQSAPDTLILPHPRLQDRAFVLVPLMDVAPDWRHPLTGATVAEMHDALPEADRDAVRPLSP